MDNQSLLNYGYDAIGNLIRDDGENIQEIKWNAYGKISSITRTGNNNKSNLEFGYDAVGQRLWKTVKPRTGGNPSNQNEWKTTWYVRDATGNVIATYLETFEQRGSEFDDKLTLIEQNIYGASRIGNIAPNLEIVKTTFNSVSYQTDGKAALDGQQPPIILEVNLNNKQFDLGKKRYELSNHLGNVLAVVSDRKHMVDDGQYDNTGWQTSTTLDNQMDYYVAEYHNFGMYYAFGAPLPGRGYTNADIVYRYGFNGQEKDDEVSGAGNSNTAEFWQYDSRLGRRFNVDPVFKEYESSYACMGNNPIWIIDINGADTSVVYGSNGGYDAHSTLFPNAKQGDKHTIYSMLYMSFDKLNNKIYTGYKSVETKVYHAGNDYGAAGWYSEEEYEYINRDWAGGQVLNKLSGLNALFTDARDWNGWAVNSDGYLTGQRMPPTLAMEFLGGKAHAKTIGYLRALAKLKQTGKYSVYHYIKDGVLYIGKAKNGEVARYGLIFTDRKKVNAFEGLSKTIPNNGIALGIEQAIMNLNGFGTPGKLANVRHATKNNILLQEGINYLNNYCPDWQTLFKLQ